MKLSILAYTALTAVLIVAVRHFELALFSGQIELNIAMTVVGALFLALGVFAGTRFRRRGAEKEVVVEYIDRPAERTAEVAPNDLLSSRESEVLRELANGLTNREIAARLFVSENTIKTHVNNIYAKLGVNRRTQAVVRARDLKLIL